MAEDISNGDSVTWLRDLCGCTVAGHRHWEHFQVHCVNSIYSSCGSETIADANGGLKACVWYLARIVFGEYRVVRSEVLRENCYGSAFKRLFN